MEKRISVFLIVCMVYVVSFCSKSVKIEEASEEIESVTEQTEKIIPEKPIDESSFSETSHHSGRFDFSMSGYKGELFIGTADGKLYGTIKFSNWGNGVPQPLTDLRVNEDKIYFRRVINTREDLLKYGGTDYFEQVFYGIFAKDGKTIRGYYRYIGTQDNWKAVRK